MYKLFYSDEATIPIAKQSIKQKKATNNLQLIEGIFYHQVRGIMLKRMMAKYHQHQWVIYKNMEIMSKVQQHDSDTCYVYVDSLPKLLACHNHVPFLG